MALSDWKNRLKNAFARKESDPVRRPDGGTSCYRPMRPKSYSEAASYQNQNNANNAFGQQVPYVHTGFTGMTPPVSYGAETPGYGQSPVYDQTMYNQTGYVQPEAYGQPGAFGTAQYYEQPAPGYQPAFTGYQPDPAERTAARPERGWFPAREESAQPGNISYMPGVAPNSGSSWSHVEHIMTMTGLKSCYEAIECMKNGETLIVMMDAIANENESMRCQDMLAGAAFTLGCNVRTLQGGRLVLIAPEDVRVLPEQPVNRMEMPPVFAPAPVPQVADHAPGRRERRTGVRPDEWDAARNGRMNQYNPYTGNMPVAAGAYGNFGGYGY